MSTPAQRIIVEKTPSARQGLSARLGEALLRAGVIDEMQLRSAVSKQQQWGGRLVKHIIEGGLASESAVADAVARLYAVPRVEMAAVPHDAAAHGKLDADFCAEHGVFPMALRDNGKALYLAMAEPGDLELVDRIAATTNCRVKVFACGEREIASAIQRHYHGAVLPELPLPEAKAIPLSTATPPPPSSPLQAAAAQARFPTPPSMPAVGTDGELAQLREKLDKTTRVLKALIEVATSKGLVTADELKAAVQKGS